MKIILKKQQLACRARFILAMLFIAFNLNGIHAQVIKSFVQRSSAATPSKLIYNIKGDYAMIGNTNLTLQSYNNNTNNSNNTMIYVDVDSNPNTLNSSSATLSLSTENGADPSCSNIIYAGLYWTGRASNSSSSPDNFIVTKGGVTKNYNKRTVSFKGPGQTTYTDFVANPGNIYYPDGTYGNMYSGYVEVTSYVKANGIGEYSVADIALIEGNGGATGYYGGWGMIVVYENSKMNWRDVTIFDGHAYVVGNSSVNFELPVSGFNTAQSGPINMKLGVMAGEGDVGISGDYFRIRNWQDNAWVTLSHSGNSTNNFFNGSVNTGGNPRNPNLQNNTGLDIAMFNIANPSNSVVTNNQTSTRFQYGSTQDTYIIFCIVMAVDAYIPDVELVVSTEYINGVPVTGLPYVAQPGQDIEYKLEVKNLGTEPVDSTRFVVPLPYTVSYVPASLTTQINFVPSPVPNNAYFDPLLGPTGSIVWDFGTLPLPPSGFPDSVLAELTFRFKVTSDCNILKNPDCPPNVVLSGGTISGVGAISGSLFNNMPFIQGYQTSGGCIGEPITDPLIVEIDAATFIADSCQNTPDNRSLVFCNYTQPNIPVSAVVPNFPIGLRFFNTNNITPTSIEYDENNPFPALSGTHTYYAIPVGLNLCYYTFTISVSNLLTTPIADDLVYCLNDVATPLTAIPSDTSYTLYFYTSSTSTTSFPSIIPSTAIAGVTTYYVAEAEPFSLGGCVSPNRTPIVVSVYDMGASISSQTNVFCKGDSTGTATVNVSGGIGNYTYQWNTSPIQNTQTAIGLPVGNYTVTVIDSNGCAAPLIVSIAIVEPADSLKIDSIVMQQVSCLGGNDGGLNISVSGGTPNYQFAWTNSSSFNSTNEDLSGLFNGEYYVTVTDDAGCNTLDSVIVTTLVDVMNPVIICSGSQIVSTSISSCDYTVSGIGWDATATDNCVVNDIAYTLTGATLGTGTSLDGVPFNLGITVVAWVATDGLGNTDQCEFQVSVVDTTSPSIIACGAGNQTINVEEGECNYTQTTSAWDATASDNCTDVTITAALSGATTATGLTTLAGVNLNTGITYVIWTVTDTVGNTATCSYEIIVIDNINPSMLSCGLGNQTVNVEEGECNYTQTTSAWDATAIDNCTVSSITATLTGVTTGSGLTTLAGVNFNTGITHVFWIVTDTVGNTTTCSYDITVIDNIDPSIIMCGAGDQTVNVDADECNYTQTTIEWDVLVTDNCTVSSITATLTGATIGADLTTLAGVDFNTGITHVIWTVTDTVGNTTTCSYDITVIDNIDPSIIMCGASNRVVSSDTGVCTYINVGLDWDATATDNCTVALITYSLSGVTTGSGLSLNGVVFNPGLTTVVWTVIDTSGNSSTCTFTVEVIDIELPIISNCPTNIVVSNDNGYCGAIVNWTPPTFTDNCSATMVSTHNTGDYFNVGTTTVTYTVTDLSGNVSNCSFDVTVNDTEAPIVVCPSPIASCDSLINFNNPIVSDNCGILSMTQIAGLPSGSIFPVGVTTITFEAIDIYNNSTQCSFDVAVHPSPILTLQATNVSCNDFSDGSIDLTVTNGTSPYTYLWSNSAITEDISNLSPDNYSVVVTDASGCSATVQTNITQPDVLTINAINTQMSCFNGNNGAIDVIVGGGVYPYTYLWNNTEITEDLSNLAIGFYQVTATDANGCVISYSTTLTQPDSLMIQTVVYDATCNAENGSIQAQITGGTTPYVYSWSNGTSGLNLNNVVAGTYTLMVTDTKLCTNQYTGTIHSLSNLVAELNTTDVSCFGGNNGAADVFIRSGNAPYTYQWSNGDTTAVSSHLTVGSYAVTVTDVFSCQVNLALTINQPDSLYALLAVSEYSSGTNVSLYGGNDGYITSTVFGGVSPLDFLWSNGETTADVYNLTAGEYSLIVTDENGCLAYVSAKLIQPYILEMPTGFSPNLDGSNDYFVVKGIEAYPKNEVTVFNRWGNIVYEKTNYTNEWDGNNSGGEPLPNATYFVIFTAFADENITLTGYVDLRR